tara:strand:- start:1057 stop:2112 length:1056 start_codon:yes stop_codon:yes gene_type:complete
LKTEKAVYTPNDFLTWDETGVLELSPKFQRRSVWQRVAQSFFIDTILRGMVAPPIYLRNKQDLNVRRVIREVVDGQQRIRTVLSYLRDEFSISQTVNATWSKKRFSQLSEDQQERIMSFSIPVEIFSGISDQEVLEVFCRLNLNSVPLNKQEKRNGQYFGPFKQQSFGLAISYLDFWRQHKLFTEQSIARMKEVELTSELLIAGIDGMQDKKSTIDDYYENYEEKYPNSKVNEKQFKQTMEEISEAFETELASSQFHRPPLFYTLYCVVFHHMFGLPNAQRSTPRRRLTLAKRESLREAVIELSTVISRSKSATETRIPKKYAQFVIACQRSTDAIAQRKERFNTLYSDAF